MTKKEYNEKLNSIIHRLSTDNAQRSIKMLDELYEYKPVGLKWFIARANAMLKAGEDPDSIMGFLENRAWYGYNYPGLEELSELLARLCKEKGDELDAKRNRLYPWICFGKPYQKYSSEIENEYAELRQREIDFCGDIYSDEKASALLDSFFVTGNRVGYLLLSCLLKKRGAEAEYREKFIKYPNFGWLEGKLLSDNEDTFIIVVSDEDDAVDCDTASVIISLLGKKVFVLDIPVECPVDEKINIADTLSVSLENVSDNNGITIIPPVRVVMGGKPLGDNRAEIIDHIIKNRIDEHFAVTLCGGELIDELRERPLLRRQMQRLNPFTTSGEERYLSFARTGDYTVYVSEIYDFDVKSAINAPAECDYSIVVPARNSATTLRYTLMTCLEQQYKGSYEIVLSDNSTNGNTEVYELYKELNDPRIKYYKTPRDLHLTKSFEYAYFHAKGEFIFSIGSDDGVFPWTLESVDLVRKQFPDEEIISWDRGFYVWPGFVKAQENELIIPSCYKKKEIHCNRVDLADNLRHLAKDRNSMYLLPMMYINSGFKRSYFNTLLKNTGCFLDGPSQDIYFGAVNACLYKTVLHLNFPITIAGMSGNSLNAKTIDQCPANLCGSSLSSMPTKYVHSVGEFSDSATERLIPSFYSDLQGMYSCIFRTCTMGLRTLDSIKALFDEETMLNQILSDIAVYDSYFDNRIHYFRYVISKNFKRFSAAFEKNYDSVVQPRLIKYSENQEKLYEEGFVGDGLFLDASKFGVTNVYEAVELYGKILNL